MKSNKPNRIRLNYLSSKFNYTLRKVRLKFYFNILKYFKKIHFNTKITVIQINIRLIISDILINFINLKLIIK